MINNQLDKNETEFLEAYRQLDIDGKVELMDYMKALLEAQEE